MRAHQVRMPGSPAANTRAQGRQASAISEAKPPVSLPNTHRIVSPAVTLERLRPLLPMFGITRVANITGLDDIGIPVAAAYRPNSRNISVSQGKGLDLVSAKVSAIMEAVEGFHAEQILKPLKLATYEEISKSERVVKPDDLPSVPNTRFHVHLPILWIAARSLIDGETIWVPFENVHTNYTLPLPTGSGCFQASSNGLGAGNHLLEAISHGICEVVERDATALWRASGGAGNQAKRLSLSSVDDAACREVLERYERADLQVAAWETTTDVAISSFACMISSRSHSAIADGMGCHPDRSTALLRALTEAAQAD